MKCKLEAPITQIINKIGSLMLILKLALGPTLFLSLSFYHGLPNQAAP